MVPRQLFNPSLGKVRSYAVDEKLHIGPLNSVTIGEDRIEWLNTLAGDAKNLDQSHY